MKLNAKGRQTQWEFAKGLGSFGKTTPEENSSHSSVLKLCLNCGNLSFRCRTKHVVFSNQKQLQKCKPPFNRDKFDQISRNHPFNNGPTKQPNKQQAVKPKVLGQHPTCKWHSAGQRDAPRHSAPLKQQQLDLSQRNVHGSIEV